MISQVVDVLCHCLPKSHECKPIIKVEVLNEKHDDASVIDVREITTYGSILRMIIRVFASKYTKYIYEEEKDCWT